MKEIFAELFNLVHRYERPLSVFMLDLDHFKDVNDSNDHLVGSTVLKEIGRILKEHTRKSDIQIRYGGDEFVVLMPETPVDSALRVAERVRKTISELSMTVNPDYVVKVTASLGVSTFDKSRHSEYWELLREADMAMYSAKKMGRNRVTVYGGEVQGYDTTKSSFASVLKNLVDVEDKRSDRKSSGLGSADRRSKNVPSELSTYLQRIKKGET
jgi:diguanylate cyclase (GGDEF)-like protein